MGVVAFGSVILDAQSQGAGRHQWDVNVINAVKVAKVGTRISRGNSSTDSSNVSHLDLKCRLNHIRAHYRHRKACHSSTVQTNIYRPQAQFRLLRDPRTHLD